MNHSPASKPKSRSSAFRRWLVDWHPGDTKHPFLIALALSLLHSLLFALAMPLLSWWPLSLIAIVPLVIAVGLWPMHHRLRWLFVAVLLGCLPRELYQHWWIGSVSMFGMPILATVMSLWTALFATLLAFTHHRLPKLPMLLASAILWLGVEHFRARLFMGGYAWGFVVHPLIDWPAAAAWASVGGVWLVSILVAIGSSGIAQSILLLTQRGKDKAHCAVIQNLATAIIAYTTLSLGSTLIPKPTTSRPISIAVVQTNVPQSNKLAWSLADEVKDFASFRTMTREVANDSPAVIVWPETMMPGVSIQPDVVKALADAQVTFDSPTPLPDSTSSHRIDADEFSRALLELSRELNIPMLIGEEGFDDFSVDGHADGSVEFIHTASYNSVFLVNKGQVAPTRYDKIELTPFGEYMPIISRFDWLEDALLSVAASGMKFDLSSGHNYTVLDVPVEQTANAPQTVRCVTPICFEVTVPELCRQLVYKNGERRADVLINVTNDGWFTTSDRTRIQHLQIARWRCVELATPMARAANTGVSAWIDAQGKVIRDNVQVCDDQGNKTNHEGAARVGGVATQAIELSTQTSIYAGIGDVIPWLCTPLSAVFILASFIQGRRNKLTSTKQNPA